MSKYAEAWFSVDVETSGAVPGVYDLVSIGTTVIDHGNIELLTRDGAVHSRPKFYVEVKPHSGRVDPEATAIHKLTPEYLHKAGIWPANAIESFVDWVKEVAGAARPVFCSWGTFDWMWMGWYLERYGKRYTYPFGPNSLDLKSYYLGLTKGGEWRATQKWRMPEDDLRGGHTHNALDDAVEQAEMVEGWLKKYANAV